MVGLVVLARTRRFGVFRTTQLLAFLVLPALLQASLGGFVASSAMILWAIFTARGARPTGAAALGGVVGGVFAELVVLGLLDPRLSEDPASLPTGLVITFFVLNVMGLTLSAYVMLGYFVEQRERAHRAGGGAGAVGAPPAERPARADRRAPEGRYRGDRGSLRHGERALRGPRRLHPAVVGPGRRRAGGPPG